MSSDVPIIMFHAKMIRRKEFEERDSAYKSISVCTSPLLSACTVIFAVEIKKLA